MNNKVLFVSENTLERAENLCAIFEAYQGIKRFRQGWDDYKDAPRLGYSAVVIDTMPPYMPNKGECKVVFIGHGIPGGKSYGFDMPIKYVDERVRGQIDYAICPSHKERRILASQTGVQYENVLPMGMPRTDILVGSRKGDGGTVLAKYKRAYLYLPTFRGGYEEAPLPTIDWQAVDELLTDDEVFLVKRHYFTGNPLVNVKCSHVIEADNQSATLPYVIDCDALLTDFSSVSWDAFLAGKPVVFGTDGAAGYLRHRGMYYEYPQGYCSRWLELENNERAMVDMLRQAAREGMDAREHELCKLAADCCDGKSSERVAKFVADLISE